MKGYDYTQNGAYFVTLVTWQRQLLFGEIVHGEMRLNQYGEIVYEEWLKTAQIRSNVEMYDDQFLVMPNHVHGIIWIVETDVGATRNEGTIHPGVGATRRVAPTKPVAHTSQTLISNSIGAIVGQIKSSSAKRINALRDQRGVPIWQRNYYEHIIRNEKELEVICDYIRNNPLKWLEDQENPAIALLKRSRK